MNSIFVTLEEAVQTQMMSSGSSHLDYGKCRRAQPEREAKNQEIFASVVQILTIFSFLCLIAGKKNKSALEILFDPVKKKKPTYSE